MKQPLKWLKIISGGTMGDRHQANKKKKILPQKKHLLFVIVFPSNLIKQYLTMELGCKFNVITFSYKHEKVIYLSLMK